VRWSVAGSRGIVDAVWGVRSDAGSNPARLLGKAITAERGEDAAAVRPREPSVVLILLGCGFTILCVSFDLGCLGDEQCGVSKVGV
jgi:hypothetical protein